MKYHALIAIALVATLSSEALAAGPAASTNGAEQLVAEGNRFYAEHDFEAARLKYLEALATSTGRALLCNLARAEAKLGRWAEAYRHYRAYLESRDLSNEDRRITEEIAHDLEQRVGRIKVTAPVGAHVQVDGKDLGEAPFKEPLSVEPGLRQVKLGTEQKSVACAAGRVAEVTFEVGRPPPSPEPSDERGSWLLPGALAGVGLVGLGVGAGLGVAASDESDSARTLDAVSVTSFALGGAALIGAVVVAVVSQPWRVRRPSATAIVPIVAPGLAVVGFGASF